MRTPYLSLVFMLSGLMACASPSEGDATQAEAQDVTAKTVLLDCNVFLSGGGPDQQVTIERREDGLVLRELTNHGGWVERELTEEEWKSEALALRLDTWDLPGTVNRLYKDADGFWTYESKGGGWLATGTADCANPRNR